MCDDPTEQAQMVYNVLMNHEKGLDGSGNGPDGNCGIIDAMYVIKVDDNHVSAIRLNSLCHPRSPPKSSPWALIFLPRPVDR